MASDVTFGYGAADSPGNTERQTVVVKVTNNGVQQDISKFGLERVSEIGAQRPTGSNVTRLERPESAFADYQLLPAGDAGRWPHKVFSTPVTLTSSVAGERTVTVTYELTLDRRGSAQVNDDIIIQMPTLSSCS